MSSEYGIVPRRVREPAEAFAVLRSEGAVILTGAGSSGEDARGIAQRVLASLEPIVPDPAPIKEGGGNKDNAYRTWEGEDRRRVPFQSGHTDGFAYGDKYPDYIFLLCIRPAASGGESFSVDTYRILAALAASGDPEDAAFLAFLTGSPVEQTEPGFVRSLAPVVLDNGRGRRMARWTPVQRPNPALTSEEQIRQRTWLERWKALAYQASQNAPRFLLQPGEALCLDNYRMLHGREGFDDLERTMWRIWAWTTESTGAPDGLLFSDSRFAVAPSPDRVRA